MRPTLCDVNLITDGGRRIAGHKGVITSALAYFNAMFTGSDTVDTNEDNVQQLLAGAKMLDCVDIMLRCADLQNFSLNYIHNNFIQISSSSDEFLQLPTNRLIDIISSDFIHTGEVGEQVILSAFISWINYDLEKI
ncbi:eRF1: BTB: and Kelch domain containing protein-like protein [Dinothrombium tinctorium]|uniref:ERF1: BTB: and Kelch domain containing protein-like protein n=1 Tax=Dinothrombium tinctorium TaxID=1965070 RepID=A0A3S3NFJ3_9ACAR|nr:eRF1: BTB: and Kelch domain containing protein-like protein [Dinothrombium tinctorium]